MGMCVTLLRQGDFKNGIAFKHVREFMYTYVGNLDLSEILRYLWVWGGGVVGILRHPDSPGHMFVWK